MFISDSSLSLLVFSEEIFFWSLLIDNILPEEVDTYRYHP